MCFDIDEDFPNELIADANITCYKVGRKCISDNSFISLVQKFVYLMGIEYELENKLNNDLLTIYEGFHSYVNKKQKDIYHDLVTVLCIIPKGAKYYYNDKDKTYVSNKIIIKKSL